MDTDRSAHQHPFALARGIRITLALLCLLSVIAAAPDSALASPTADQAEVHYKLTAWFDTKGQWLCAGADYQFKVQIQRTVTEVNADGERQEINAPFVVPTNFQVNATVQDPSVISIIGGSQSATATGSSTLTFKFHALQHGQTLIDLKATVFDGAENTLGGGGSDFIEANVRDCDYLVTVSLYGIALLGIENIVYLGQYSFLIQYDQGHYRGDAHIPMSASGTGECHLTYSTLYMPVDVLGPPIANDELTLSFGFGSTTGKISATCEGISRSTMGSGDLSSWTPTLTFPAKGGTQGASSNVNGWPANILVTVTPWFGQ